MKFFTALSTLVGAGLVHGRGNIIPTSGTEPLVERDGIGNLTFYIVNFDVKAPILRFESTLIIPAASPDPNITNDVQAIWPGLQTDTLLQNVVTNLWPTGGGPHGWYLLPFYCCDPPGNLTDQIQIYPGDLLTNTFVWDVPQNKWLDNWVLTPGEEGSKAGQKAFQGGLTFDQAIALEKAQNKIARPYDTPEFAIELQGLGTWDFGPVTWKNILIEANTTETDWCTKIKTPSNMHIQNTAPVVTSAGTVTSCYIGNITFIASIKTTPRRRLRIA